MNGMIPRGYQPPLLRDQEPEKEKGPGFLDRFAQLFGGAPNPMLTAEQNKAAQREALTMAGLNMMMASGPQASGIRPALGQIIAAGAMGGRETGGARRQEMMGTSGLQRIRELFGAEEAPSRAQMEQMLRELILSGDMDSATILTEYMKSMPGLATQPAGQIKEVATPTGTRYALIDPRTGQVQLLDYGPAEEEEGMSDYQTDMMAQRAFQRESGLRDDYYQEVKPIESAYNFIDVALQNRGLAEAGDGAAQVAMLYAFVKAMDPESVVREGEVRLAQEAASLRQRAMGLYQKTLQGQSVVIPGDLVEQMADFMTSMQIEKEYNWQERYDNVVGRASRWGVEAEAFRAPPTDYRQRAGIVSGATDIDAELEK